MASLHKTLTILVLCFAATLAQDLAATFQPIEDVPAFNELTSEPKISFEPLSSTADADNDADFDGVVFELAPLNEVQLSFDEPRALVEVVEPEIDEPTREDQTVQQEQSSSSLFYLTFALVGVFAGFVAYNKPKNQVRRNVDNFNGYYERL
mmetsp:Transcript_12649/g.13893  ORF Transcript_12649/g.13893 Transcript_12649/m.13893 type:complete len:151 (+) Transcript_12649:78-530(+)|eukprot:CAMPEP_0115005702 /NCGR_PEP_ID=MMETSP0216-20121206/20043_1 /TAXON_ID=223996 /ORGANISM="Protocruzia adherens, Strain Boccale" /LENGTH=150 /DNA_ID=CAMNT_0002372107 /DNA_START=74 /DNA_END=526 /DNA_ORIENTATION=-